jgi:hypothetical protein
MKARETGSSAWYNFSEGNNLYSHYHKKQKSHREIHTYKNHCILEVVDDFCLCNGLIKNKQERWVDNNEPAVVSYKDTTFIETDKNYYSRWSEQLIFNVHIPLTPKLDLYTIMRPWEALPRGNSPPYPLPAYHHVYSSRSIVTLFM